MGGWGVAAGGFREREVSEWQGSDFQVPCQRVRGALRRVLPVAGRVRGGFS